MALQFTPKQLDSFHKAAVSLKLFSRSELNDEKNRSLIEKLYVDPLPNEQVFKTLLASNTTVIVGRKGTGKSTVFQRVQHEIRKGKSNAISAYMDIRNVYEASQIDPITSGRLGDIATALSPEQIQKFLLYKKFLKSLIVDIRDELKSQVEQSFLTRLREQMIGSSAEVFAGLDKVIERLDEPDYENIEGFVTVERKATEALKNSQNRKQFAKGSVSPNLIGAEGGYESSKEKSTETGAEDVYTQLLMRVIGVNDVIRELQKLLAAIGIRNLYIFLDDFSELPRDAMRLLVDALISPLSRWSDFIKFKIAAYPGRVYLGDLDNTKVEEVNLDIYGLYGSAGVTKMEEKAIDFTKRVVEKRLAHFAKTTPDIYFGSRSGDFWRNLFYASMANPRTLGHILLYAHESNLIYNQVAGVASIQDAAQRYYEEKVSPFFANGRYRVAFEERSSVYSLKELLESVVSKARSIRQEGSRDHSSGGRSRPYASHFYVSSELEDIFQSLELSFFLTKYFEQSDRGGKRVSVFALNYGLCTKYQIAFGRPSERREDRLYFVDRRFDYNVVVSSYLRQNQEIKCNSCGAEFDLSMLPALQRFRMRCPDCQEGQCSVINLSKKYGDALDAVRPELLLPDAEIGILQTLHIEDRTMVAAEIAGELDCSGQLVGRRAKHLAERELVTRVNAGNVYRYELTDAAKTAYFSDPSAADLDIDGA